MRIVRLVDVLARHGYLRASKAVMAMLGIDSGTVRLPLRPLAAGDQAAIRSDLEAAGFIDILAPGTEHATSCGHSTSRA
jgi:N-acetylneuraminate lyase